MTWACEGGTTRWPLICTTVAMAQGPADATDSTAHCHGFLHLPKHQRADEHFERADKAPLKYHRILQCAHALLHGMTTLQDSMPMPCSRA